METRLDARDRSFVTRILGLSLVLHLLAAVCSVGWQNTDEHFQILEFLSHWLGRSEASDLPIEFHRQMRPWLQPYFHLLPIGLLRAAGVEDPFAWATAVRLQSALVGWLSVVALTRAAWRWIPDRAWARFATLAASLMWFLPALHARHSSENLAGACLAIAVAALSRESPRRFWVSGLLAGAAFEFRYQTGVMTLGLFAWLAFLCEEAATSRLKRLVEFSTGALLVVGLGTVLDRLGYGQWVLAPWNYFQFNIAEGGLEAAGVHPAWDYFRRAWTESWPILGFLTLMTFIVTWFRHPRHVLTWSTAPFFLFHSLIGHKETRFLFPMVHLAPLTLALALHSLRPGTPPPRAQLWAASTLRRKLVKWAVAFVVALNLIALASLSLLPALFPIRFYSAVYRLSSEALHSPLRLRFLAENPFVVNGIAMNFYRPAGLELGALREDTDRTEAFWLAHPGPTLPQSRAGLAERCQARFNAYPGWITDALGPLAAARLRNWTLFRCEPLRRPTFPEDSGR